MLVTVGLIVLGLVVLALAPAAIALVGIAWEALSARAPREDAAEQAAAISFGSRVRVPAQERL